MYSVHLRLGIKENNSLQVLPEKIEHDQILYAMNIPRIVFIKKILDFFFFLSFVHNYSLHVSNPLDHTAVNQANISFPVLQLVSLYFILAS